MEKSYSVKVRKFILMCVVASSIPLSGQMKMKWISGDFEALKNEMGVKLVFDFDSTTVGRFPNDSSYIEYMRNEKNEKESGSGREWVQEWMAAKKEIYDPRFRKLFFKYSKLDDDEKFSNYTLVFKPRHTEPGASAFMNIPACIDGEMWLYKSSDPDKVLGRLAITKVLGEKSYYKAPTVKLGEAYAIAGRTLGAYIGKRVKK